MKLLKFITTLIIPPQLTAAQMDQKVLFIGIDGCRPDALGRKVNFDYSVDVDGLQIKMETVKNGHYVLTVTSGQHVQQKYPDVALIDINSLQR